MLRWFMLFLLCLLIVPALAFGADPTVPERHGLVLDQAQLWTLVIGIFTPLVGYAINTALFKRLRAGIPEPVATAIQVILAAVGAAIYTAVSTNSFGWNTQTLQLIITSVIAAFAAHGLLWKPSGVQARLVRR